MISTNNLRSVEFESINDNVKKTLKKEIDRRIENSAFEYEDASKPCCGMSEEETDQDLHGAVDLYETSTER